MKYRLVIFCLGILFGCSDKKLEQPEGVGFNLRMATVGASRFEDYIHDLNIYAFRKTANGGYVYAQTLAELEADGIRALQDGSAEGDSKFFITTLTIGTYELYLVGNAADRLSGEFIEGVTVPGDIQINSVLTGQDSVYFLGHVAMTVAAANTSPVEVTLNRVVSKLMLVLYRVPVQIDSIRVSLGNLATRVNLKGEMSGESRVVTETLRLTETAYAQDTVVGELVTLPSLIGGASLQLTFYAVNGQEKLKEMPGQTLLPDRYLRVVGVVNDKPGALLSFEVSLNLFLFDYWVDYQLPDFSLNKQER